MPTNTCIMCHKSAVVGPSPFGKKRTVGSVLECRLMVVIHVIFVVLRHHCHFRKQLHSLVGSMGARSLTTHVASTLEACTARQLLFWGACKIPSMQFV
eukprot:365182-Amphidinium_carterae.1